MDIATIVQILESTVRLATPLLFACLAGLFSERAGIVDIGLEGKILIAAFFSAAIAYVSGSAWLGLLAGIAAAITWGALATLVTGVVVILGAAAGAVRARTYEAAILKTLGASRRRILLVFAIRSALMGAAAGLVAIFAGAAAAWAVMTFVMETDFVFEPRSATLIVAGGALATLFGGLAFVWGPMAVRPASVLRAAE